MLEEASFLTRVRDTRYRLATGKHPKLIHEISSFGVGLCLSAVQGGDLGCRPCHCCFGVRILQLQAEERGFGGVVKHLCSEVGLYGS